MDVRQLANHMITRAGDVPRYLAGIPVLEIKPVTWWAKWSKYNLRRAARTD